jgi:vancomycin resistance protein YoaR
MQKKIHLRPRLALSALAILILISLLFADYLYHRQRIYSGVSIGGITVGGMTVDEACLHLNSKLMQEGFTDKPLFFSLDESNWTFSLAELGVNTSLQCCLDAYHTGRGRYHLFSYPARIGLVFKNINIPLSFSVDEDRFSSSLSGIQEEVRLEALEARLGLTDDKQKVVIVPEKYGRELDLDTTRQRLTEALTSYPTLPEVELAVMNVQAKVTAAYLETLRVREEIATSTTVFSHAIPNRVHNIRLAAASLDGALVEPDQEFSFNQTVGVTGAEQGYKPAPVIVNRRLVEGIGGGVCQVSSTLYNAILLADLALVERANHSLTVGYLPPGLDATVSDGWLDLRFLNNRNHAVWIRTFIEGSSLIVRLYGDPIPGHEVKIIVTDREVINQDVKYIETEELPEGVTEKNKNGQPGYRVTVWRITYIDGEEIRREKISRDVYTPVPDEYRIGVSSQSSMAPDEYMQENGEEKENQLAE